MKSLLRMCVVVSVTLAANVTSYCQVSPSAVGGTNPHPQAVGGTNPHPLVLAPGNLFMIIASVLGF